MNVHQHTILVVDDNRHLAHVIRLGLTKDGHAVRSAETGDEAVDIIGKLGFPDLVITDAIMPGVLQGQGLARWVKVREPSLPVILMSGFIGAGQLTPSEEAAVDLFIEKPISLAALSEAVQATLSRQAEHRATQRLTG